MFPADARPRLRPIEPIPDGEDRNRIGLRDPTGVSPHLLSVSRDLIPILAMLDGRHDLADIQVDAMRRTGRMLFSDQLDELLEVLDSALFLEGPRVAAALESRRAAYRAAPVRPMIAADGLDENATRYFEELFAPRPGEEPVASRSGRLLGFVAPHLDYPRGRPCYAAAYGDLARHCGAVRFVILGTNHRGATRSVVGTRKDFETPFGPVMHDAAFMDRMDRAVGADLCAHELDHLNEHSVELQVHLLRHVMGDRPFRMAAYLCPDPCQGRARGNGEVDLSDFARALRDMTTDEPTCLIAGADLSHVGGYFQDPTPLDDDHLKRLDTSDRRALQWLEAGDPERFRTELTAAGNPTHVCSAGCLYVVATALQGRSQPRLRRYHQAVTREIENCVTCCAMDFVEA